MRKLVIAFVGIELLALCACGYAIAEDPELTDALYWVREFKAEQPDAARAIALGCKDRLTASAYLSRDGALQLFTCIRREAEAQGYA
jgi:hypothetical protein